MDTILICFFPVSAGSAIYLTMRNFNGSLLGLPDLIFIPSWIRYKNLCEMRESRKYMSGIVGRWWDCASTISSVLACPIIVACEQKPGKRWRSRHILGPTHSRPRICSTRTHFTRRTEEFLAETHGFLEHTFVTISINKCKAQTHWNYNVLKELHS